MIGGLFDIILSIILAAVSRSSIFLFLLVFGGLFFLTGFIVWRRDRKNRIAKNKTETQLQKNKQLKQQVCSVCGTQLDLGSLYCWKCGIKIGR